MFHRICVRQMCKQCCISQSGCNAPKHNFKFLSEKQKTKAQSLRFTSSHPPSFYTTQPSFELDPSLSPKSDNFFNSLGNTATTASVFLKADDRPPQEEHAEHATQVAAEREDEFNYQAAVAASLRDMSPASGDSGLILSSSHVITSVAPAPSQLSYFQPAIPRNLPPVETVPYEPTITRHLNPHWMRKTTDNTKKNMKVPRANPNNKFSIVFWGKVYFFEYSFIAYTNQKSTDW